MISGQIVAHIEGEQVGPFQRPHIGGIPNILILFIPGSPGDLLRHGITEIGGPIYHLHIIQVQGLTRIHMAHIHHLVVQEDGYIFHFLAVIISKGTCHLAVKAVDIPCEPHSLLIGGVLFHHKEFGVERPYIIGFDAGPVLAVMDGDGGRLLPCELGDRRHVVVDISRKGIKGVILVQIDKIRLIIRRPHIDKGGLRHALTVRVLNGGIGEKRAREPGGHSHEKDHSRTAQGEDPHGRHVIAQHSPVFHEKVEARPGQDHIGHCQGHIQPHLWKFGKVSCIDQGLYRPVLVIVAPVHGAAQAVDPALSQQGGKEIVYIGDILLAKLPDIREVIHGYGNDPLSRRNGGEHGQFIAGKHLAAAL